MVIVKAPVTGDPGSNPDQGAWNLGTILFLLLVDVEFVELFVEKIYFLKHTQ
jgi:hypothetical protein